jgi:hypothetical protein
MVSRKGKIGLDIRYLINKCMRANEFTEASYPGNIGAMEVMRFMQTATPRQKTVLRKLIDADQLSKAWQMIQKVTGVRLQGHEFSEAYQGGPITD